MAPTTSKAQRHLITCQNDLPKKSLATDKLK